MDRCRGIDHTMVYQRLAPAYGHGSGNVTKALKTVLVEVRNVKFNYLPFLLGILLPFDAFKRYLIILNNCGPFNVFMFSIAQNKNHATSQAPRMFLIDNKVSSLRGGW